MVEVGHDQADRVAALFEASGLETTEPLRDLGGHQRVVAARHHRGGKTQGQMQKIEN